MTGRSLRPEQYEEGKQGRKRKWVSPEAALREIPKKKSQVLCLLAGLEFFARNSESIFESRSV